MIPVTLRPEPRAPEYDFHRDVHLRGQDAIRQLAGLPALETWPGRNINKRVDRIDDVTPNFMAHRHR